MATPAPPLIDAQTSPSRARALATLLTEGKSFAECGVEMGETAGELYRFSRTAGYRRVARSVAPPTAPDAPPLVSAAPETHIRNTRAELAKLLPRLPVYIERCLRTDEKGEMVDDSKAMWAAQVLAKATGLDVPEQVMGQGGPVTINIGTIHTELVSLRADDAESAAQARALDITPLEERATHNPEPAQIAIIPCEGIIEKSPPESAA